MKKRFRLKINWQNPYYLWNKFILYISGLLSSALSILVPSHENIIIETTEECCRLCSGKLTYKFTLKVLQKYHANCFKCDKCYSLIVINPFWLSEAYQKEDELALTVNCDSGRFGRNFTTYLYIQVLTQSGLIRKSDKIIDFGGGYGLLTAMLRQSGYDAWTFDEYIDKPLLSGNYHIDDLSAIPDQSIDVITAFEVLEHLLDPVSTWRQIRRILKKDGIFLVSTCLYDAAVHQQDWWYLTPEQGQHITLWSNTALRKYAEDFGFVSVQAFPSFATANNGFSVFILSPIKEDALSGFIQHAEKAIYHLPEQHILADWDVSGVQKAIVQDFELNKIVPLMESNCSAFILTSGWSHLEPWGVWSHANAEIQIDLPKDCQGTNTCDLQLSLFMRIFNASAAKPKEVIIKINGQLIEKKLIGEQKTINIPLDSKTLQGQTKNIKIQFSIPAAESPKQIGMSEDARILGMGLSAYKIVKRTTN